MSRALIEFLETIVPLENVRQQEPMAAHTTFRVGGPADVFVTVSEEEQLRKILKYLDLTGWSYFLLGCGSNLLVSDRGYRGVVIRLDGAFGGVRVDGRRITAGSSALLSQVARAACENSLCGLEFASGIPGSVGGGVRMNAGAYGGEMAQVVRTVRVMYKDGSIMELDNNTMEFGYRSSVLKDRPYVVLDVTMELEEGKKEEILERMKELAARRREKQPLEYPSAGSTFKRPVGQFAGKLIEDCGLRGFRVGGAAISEKHCGFVVNLGNATCADVVSLTEQVRQIVLEKTGCTLEREIRVVE